MPSTLIVVDANCIFEKLYLSWAAILFGDDETFQLGVLILTGGGEKLHRAANLYRSRCGMQISTLY